MNPELKFSGIQGCLLNVAIKIRKGQAAFCVTLEKALSCTDRGNHVRSCLESSVSQFHHAIGLHIGCHIMACIFASPKGFPPSAQRLGQKVEIWVF